MRNPESTILKAIGIFLVVVLHTGQQPFTLFPVGSFTIALFFFISGSFFKQAYEDHPAELARRRAQKLLLPFFLYYLAYCALSYLLETFAGVSGAGRTPDLYTFLLDPFILGGYSNFTVPGWYIPQLFILQVVFAFSHKAVRQVVTNLNLQLPIFLGLGLLGTYLAREGWDSGAGYLLIRTLYGSFFFFLGFYYRNVLEKLPIFRAPYLFALVALQYLLVQFYDVTSIVYQGVFHGQILLPYVAGVTGIYFSLWVAKGLARILPPGDLIYQVGENTLHIALNHNLAMYLLSVAVIVLRGKDLAVLTDVYFHYAPERYWLVYTAVGILAPVAAVLLFGWVRRHVWQGYLSPRLGARRRITPAD